MTATAQPEVMTLILVDRQPSSWIKTEDDGRGGPKPVYVGGQPVALDRPDFKFIKTESSIRVYDESKKAWKLRKIRRIMGCDTIFADEQDKLEIKPDKFRDSEGMVFTGATMTVSKDGDLAYFDYLLNYEGNVDAPSRPKNAKDVYKILKTEAIAKDSVEVYLDERRALAYVDALVLQENGKVVSYKESEINFLMELFGLGFKESYHEKFKVLIMEAKSNPERFLTAISEARNSILTDISMAQSDLLKVLKFDTVRALLIPTQEVLLTFKTKNAADRTDELASYFGSKEGAKMYSKFQIELQKAKENSVAVQ